jgi:adenine-specific DNA-methyltransferase
MASLNALVDLRSTVHANFVPGESPVVFEGSCFDFVKSIPDDSVGLVVTSPPYNIGKSYEKRLKLADYLDQQQAIIRESVRVLHPSGSICWQVGNYVDSGEIVPLDTLLYPIFQGLGLKMRNRIIWHFEHGLHCSKRFSGRYETIMWFTKSDDYVFNLDPVRVPQKYPGKKHFKGPKAGEYSSNPLGKNPGDLWVIPNVKSNHVEKTDHPCQFPVELVERLVLSMTDPGAIVFDPFLGVGSAIVAAVKHGRRGIGSEISNDYCETARLRIRQALAGTLKTRAMHTPVNPFVSGEHLDQPRLLESKVPYAGDAHEN